MAPHRATLLGLPVGVVVALELLAVAGLLGWGASRARVSLQLPGSALAEWLPGVLFFGAALVALAGILLLVPGGPGQSLAGRLGRRIAFATSRRVSTAGEDGGAGSVDAALPGVQVRSGGGGQRQAFAVVSWGGGLTAFVRVTPGPEGVPVTQVWQSLGRMDVPVDALLVISESDRADVIVAVRIRPADSHAALEARGGGWAGAQGALAAVVSAVMSGCSTASEHVRVLGVEEVHRWLAGAIDAPGAPNGSVAQSWRLATAPSHSHLALVATRWDPQAHGVIDLLAAGAAAEAAAEGAGVRVTAEVRAGSDGRPRVRVLAVASAPNAAKATRVADALRNVAGVRARASDGEHLDALRASLGLADGAVIEAARGRHPVAAPLQSWLVGDLDGLDSLGPRLPGPR